VDQGGVKNSERPGAVAPLPAFASHVRWCERFNSVD
jgi:hypothetical protein